MVGSAGRTNDAYFHFDNDMLREVHTFLTRITVYGLRKKSLESMLAILKRRGRVRGKREGEERKRKERREEGGGEMEKERGGGGGVKRKRGRNGGKRELKF